MLFAMAAMRVAEWRRGRVGPGKKIKGCRALNGLKSLPTAGLTATAQLLIATLASKVLAGHAKKGLVDP